MSVVVVPHDPGWSKRFDAESESVTRALGASAVAVHHIGSTAIPGIRAKPIIDMLVEVTHIDAVDRSSRAMEALGYEVMGEFGLAGRRYFRKDDEAGVRTYQVHVFTAASAEVDRHLAFRDFMLEHSDWAVRYSDLKQRLARAHPDDPEGYMDGKDAFIKEVDRRAAVGRSRRDGST